MTTMPANTRISVQQYHNMISAGVLTEDDRIELLEGLLVEKMPHDPIHDGTIQIIQDALSQVLPANWCLRIQSAITLSASEPEPDIAVVRGNVRSYLGRHPVAVDIGILIEVSNSSLASDRADKGPIYAHSGVPIYWIVNLSERQIEVYEQPSGPQVDPGYASCRISRFGDEVALALGGVAAISIPVSLLLP